MKQLILIATLVAIAMPAAFAAKADKKKPAKGDRKAVAGLVRGADKNSNHKIDDDEVAGLREAFGKAGDGAKMLDRDSNGSLDDAEIKAINARMEKRGERKRKAKK